MYIYVHSCTCLQKKRERERGWLLGVAGASGFRDPFRTERAREVLERIAPADFGDAFRERAQEFCDLLQAPRGPDSLASLFLTPGPFGGT